MNNPIFISKTTEIPDTLYLVTGGCGFIGSHLILKLLETGNGVICIDNLSNSTVSSLHRVSKILKHDHSFLVFYNIDLLNYSTLQSLFKHHNGKIDSVFHMAALKSVGQSVSFPLDYYDNNVVGSINLFKVMKEFNVKRILFSSSATVYDALSCKPPFIETSKLEPINPYGKTKAMVEQILNDWYQADNEMSIIVLRYFNPVGAHESGEIGENPVGTPNNLFPYILKVLSGKLEYLSIYGSDYDTIDGTGARDYIHIMDLVDAHFKSIKLNKGLHIFNVGTGKAYTVLEILSIMETIARKSIPFKYVERRSGDVSSCYCNPNKIEKYLGWTATLTIQDMCKDAYNWKIKNPNGY